MLILLQFDSVHEKGKKEKRLMKRTNGNDGNVDERAAGLSKRWHKKDKFRTKLSKKIRKQQPSNPT